MGDEPSETLQSEIQNMQNELIESRDDSENKQEVLLDRTLNQEAREIVFSEYNKHRTLMDCFAKLTEYSEDKKAIICASKLFQFIREEYPNGAPTNTNQGLVSLSSAANGNPDLLLREIQEHLDAQRQAQQSNNEQFRKILSLLKSRPVAETNINGRPSLKTEERDSTRKTVQEFRQTINSLLDNATITGFDSVITAFDEIMSECSEFQDEFYKLIVSRASKEEDRSMTFLYAKLCQLLLKELIEPTFVSEAGKRWAVESFDLLYRKISHEFEITMNVLTIERNSYERELNNSLICSPLYKKKLRELRNVLIRRLERLLRFVGKLYNLSVVDFPTMMSVLIKLLDFPSDVIVESICDFCETNAKKLDGDTDSAFRLRFTHPNQLTQLQRFVLENTIQNLRLLKDKFPLNEKIRNPKFCRERFYE